MKKIMKLNISKNVDITLIDEEAIITNLNNGQFISINYTSYCNKGIGEKVASCILLFSYCRLDVFPIDTWVKKFMKEKYNIDTSIIEKDYNEFVNSMISIGILINE